MGAAFTQETGIVKSPDIIVDGLNADIKTITSPNGINNRAKSGKKQARMLIYDARAVKNSEEGIISDLKRAVRNHGDDLDRIVVRTIYGTLLWERRQ